MSKSMMNKISKIKIKTESTPQEVTTILTGTIITSLLFFSFTTYEYIPRQCRLVFRSLNCVCYVLLCAWILLMNFVFIKFIHGLCAPGIHSFLLQ